MRETVLQQLLERLPERRLFNYFKDRYALMLLGWAQPEPAPVRVLKSSRFGRLLAKPAVKRALHGVGKRPVAGSQLTGHWPAASESYWVTWGRWGEEGPDWRDNQTSRCGYNLVLQLSFTGKHDRLYEKWVKPDPTDPPFQIDGHPVAGEGLQTLAWARIDLDLETREALIEEVQSDWISLARWEAGDASDPEEKDRVGRYVQHALRPHARMWDEAVLACALETLFEDLGLRRVWFHTFESGVLLKGIGGTGPPRSIYTDLPRKFCFRPSSRMPRFLWKSRRRWPAEYESVPFYALELAA